jgi:Heterokaryon incompatibility protein (HET)
MEIYPFSQFSGAQVSYMDKSYLKSRRFNSWLEIKTTAPIQIGYPQLPKAGSEAQFHILRYWLKNCDETHQRLNCYTKTDFVPTRLIDVGFDSSELVRLYETQEGDAFKYVALSHSWGKSPHFQTFHRDLEKYKKGIKISDLPPTFRDAVTSTRKLGLRYLWIDSICIIQRDETDAGDFDQESGRMESVFSSAYCLFAASSAEGQCDGFLNDRESSRRDFVAIQSPGEPTYYVCPAIDDFKGHVLDGVLNKRGWVMQERVLARRAIYFTDKQAYWECGDGVRCESLARMEKYSHHIIRFQH